jgi:L-fucose isomerase-like protein
MLIQYATGRPGFISDPVIDLGSRWIVYAHCLAATKVYGPQGPEVPYKIRSHAEDRAGASLQAYWPVGEPVTTFKLNVAEKAAAIHSGVIATNVEEEKACRTKVAAASNVERILENWNRAASFGWHRVSVVGDFRRELVTAAKLLGFRVVEEDR